MRCRHGIAVCRVSVFPPAPFLAIITTYARTAPCKSLEERKVPDISQWRLDAAYDYFDDLDVEGLAWECLRRNTAYQAEMDRLTNRLADATAADDTCRRHWGLRFRDAIERYCARHDRLLGAGGRRERRAARDVPAQFTDRICANDDIAAR